jgi:hypothetical protein
VRELALGIALAVLATLAFLCAAADEASAAGVLIALAVLVGRNAPRG